MPRVCFGSGDPVYFMDNKQLTITKLFKYLGVEIASTFSWDQHINTISAKAFSILGLIKRTLYSAPKQVKVMAYTSLVRPILEYACEVWDPHLKKHQDKLEHVQSRAIRFIAGLKGISSVSAARENLGIPLLSDRRTDFRIKLLMKILSDNTHVGLMTDFQQLTMAKLTCLHVALDLMHPMCLVLIITSIITVLSLGRRATYVAST